MNSDVLSVLGNNVQYIGICPGKYFKCPQSYCLPWRLVCNGLWECPGGTEEMHCNHTACPGMFRCKNSSICISVDNLCDLIHDCHLHEDEHFCSINPIANCPLNCSCLLFSMTCEHVSLDFIHNLTLYVSINLKYINISEPKRTSLLDVFGDPFIIKIYKGELASVCKQKKTLKNLRILDISNNAIKVLKKNCFQLISNIKYLNISENIVGTIRSYTFNSSGQIEQLDLSSNNLRSLLINSFFGLLSLKSLNLSQNDIVSVNVFSFSKTIITIMITDEFKVCCFKPLAKTLCEAKPLWPNSCGRLLGDVIVKVFVWLVGSLGFVLNVTACIIIMQKSANYFKCYDRIIICLAIGDILGCTSLLTIGTVDSIFVTRYLEYEYSWRSSIICYISCVFSIVSNLLSVFSINLLTMTRYWVIKKPLKSIVLDSKLSRLCVLSIIFIFISSISITLSYILSVENQQLPTGLCLLLGHGDKSRITTILSLLSQSISCITIPTIYSRILLAIQQSTFLSEQSHRSHIAKGNIITSILVALTNLLSWIPSSILLCMTLLWKEYPYVLLIWTSMVIVPLNSIINPIVFVYFNVLKNVRQKIK